MFDVAAFYTKWERDLADAQRDDGAIPDVAPNYWPLYHDDLTWPSTFLFVPGMLYDQYGDRRVLERTYPAMKKWMSTSAATSKDGLISKDKYADWCVPPEDPKLIHSKDPARVTDNTLIATAYYYKLLRLMSHYARAAGAGRTTPPTFRQRRRREADDGIPEASSSMPASKASTTTARRPPASCRSLSTWRRRNIARRWSQSLVDRRSQTRAMATSAPAWWARNG